MTTAKMLLNWTDRDFTVEEGFNRDERGNIIWETHTLKAGEKRYFPGYLADYIAKHLIDRELHTKELTVDHHSRPALLAKCFPGDVIEAKSMDSLKTEILNRQQEPEVPVSPGPVAEPDAVPAPEMKKKPGRPKKVVPEETFAGLAK